MAKFDVTPRNETQTREWFVAHLDEFGYDVAESGTAYPDYILRDADGKTYRVEAEYLSGNFVAHGHNPSGCDFVVCWRHDTPLPMLVVELSTGKRYVPGECDGDPMPAPKPFDWRPYMDQCGAERAAFMMAMADDLRAYSEYSQGMVQPRMRLLSAQDRLEAALREAGASAALAQVGKLHPHDFFKLII